MSNVSEDEKLVAMYHNIAWTQRMMSNLMDGLLMDIRNMLKARGCEIPSYADGQLIPVSEIIDDFQ